MKVIDKTPFQDEKGGFGLWQRFQATLDYGPSWHAEVEAQKTIISQLDRILEKGFTLVRNLNLENSQIIEPLILVGPPGVFVLYVTPLTGHFEAKGDEWNVINTDRRTPAKVNLLRRVGRLASAVQVYLNRQSVYLPGVVEPVLIAASPAMHIESLRPVVRIVLSDAVKQFGASLLQTRPLLRPETVHEVVESLINPHKKTPSPEPPPVQTPVEEAGAQAAEAPQRARAIFHAAEDAKPFDPADLSFEFDENGTAEMPAALTETSPSQSGAPARRRAGLKPGQLIVLVVMVVVEFAVLAGFLYLMFFGSA